MLIPTEQTEQPEPKKRPNLRTVSVRRAEQLGPHLVRVTFQGDALAGFDTPSPTQHLKLFFPQPGQEKPIIPEPGAAQAGEARPIMRTYTVRRYDPRRLELDVEVVLHGDGPASSWASQAEPGNFVALAGPGGRRYTPDAEASWYLVAGDESALPAMSTLLEALPSQASVDVYAEVPGPEDEIELATKARARFTWLHRGSGKNNAGRVLETAIRQADIPAGPGRVWLACEAGAMRDIRKYLLAGKSLDASAIVTRGYWKYGEVNYPDHDYGED